MGVIFFFQFFTRKQFLVGWVASCSLIMKTDKMGDSPTWWQKEEGLLRCPRRGHTKDRRAWPAVDCLSADGAPRTLSSVSYS